MSATATKKKWRAHREVTIADQRTERTATALASDSAWSKEEGEFQVRELTATIHAEHGDDADSGTFVEFEVADLVTGKAGRSSHRRFTIGDTSPQGVQLGDLPLLVLALQEAIRIGVEQAAFPEIRGEKAKSE
jgi:hypothetical protein